MKMDDACFSCSICGGDCELPLSLHCGHNYCTACLLPWLRNAAAWAQSPTCPECDAAVVAPASFGVNRAVEHGIRSERKHKQLQSQKLRFHSDIVVGDVIGSGRHSTVHRGTWKEAAVAIKVHVGQSPEALESAVVAEVDFMAIAAQHPNILPLYGVVRSRTTEQQPQPPMLVYKWGVLSLWSALHPAAGAPPGPISSIARVLRTAVGCVRAVAHLHSLTPPIVHRDVSSPNVYIDAQGVPMLAGFSACRNLHNKGSSSGPAAAWRAPENFSAKDPNYGKPAGDVYALGVLINEIASKSVPFAGMDDVEIMTAVLINRERPARATEIPPALGTIIESAWQHDPSARPTSRELLWNLLALQQSVIASAESAGEDTRWGTSSECFIGLWRSSPPPCAGAASTTAQNARAASGSNESGTGSTTPTVLAVASRSAAFAAAATASAPLSSTLNGVDGAPPPPRRADGSVTILSRSTTATASGTATANRSSTANGSGSGGASPLLTQQNRAAVGISPLQKKVTTVRYAKPSSHFDPESPSRPAASSKPPPQPPSASSSAPELEAEVLYSSEITVFDDEPDPALLAAFNEKLAQMDEEDYALTSMESTVTYLIDAFVGLTLRRHRPPLMNVVLSKYEKYLHRAFDLVELPPGLGPIPKFKFTAERVGALGFAMRYVSVLDAATGAVVFAKLRVMSELQGQGQQHALEQQQHDDDAVLTLAGNSHLLPYRHIDDDDDTGPPFSDETRPHFSTPTPAAAAAVVADSTAAHSTPVLPWLTAAAAHSTPPARSSIIRVAAAAAASSSAEASAVERGVTGPTGLLSSWDSLLVRPNEEEQRGGSGPFGWSGASTSASKPGASESPASSAHGGASTSTTTQSAVVTSSAHGGGDLTSASAPAASSSSNGTTAQAASLSTNTAPHSHTAAAAAQSATIVTLPRSNRPSIVIGSISNSSGSGNSGKLAVGAAAKGPVRLVKPSHIAEYTSPITIKQRVNPLSSSLSPPPLSSSGVTEAYTQIEGDADRVCIPEAPDLDVIASINEMLAQHPEDDADAQLLRAFDAFAIRMLLQPPLHNVVLSSFYTAFKAARAHMALIHREIAPVPAMSDRLRHLGFVFHNAKFGIGGGKFINDRRISPLPLVGYSAAAASSAIAVSTAAVSGEQHLARGPLQLQHASAVAPARVPVTIVKKKTGATQQKSPAASQPSAPSIWSSSGGAASAGGGASTIAGSSSGDGHSHAADTPPAAMPSREFSDFVRDELSRNGRPLTFAELGGLWSDHRLLSGLPKESGRFSALLGAVQGVIVEWGEQFGGGGRAKVVASHVSRQRSGTQ